MPSRETSASKSCCSTEVNKIVMDGGNVSDTLNDLPNIEHDLFRVPNPERLRPSLILSMHHDFCCYTAPCVSVPSVVCWPKKPHDCFE
jgi:hypothetical protein